MNKYRTYKYVKFKKGILDNIIDAVYVITLEKSKRLLNVYKQLYDLKLCKINIIQINKKYKEKCNCNLYKQNTSHHLWNNNIEIFKHAEKKNYNNILILEDDFIFDNIIKKKQIIEKFEKFLKNNKNFNLIYLGNLPILLNPFIYSSFVNVYCTGQAHSIIYSKKARNIIIDNYEKKNYMWIDQHDMWYNFFLNERYFYYKCLCYQRLVNTENKKLWSNKFIDNFIKLFKLDKCNINNYNFYNKIIYILNFILFFILIYILYYFILYIKDTKI